MGGRWRSGSLRDRNTGNPFGCQQGQRRLSFARPIPMAVHKAQALDRHLLGGVSITSMFFPLNFWKWKKFKIKIHFNHWGTFLVFPNLLLKFFHYANKYANRCHLLLAIADDRGSSSARGIARLDSAGNQARVGMPQLDLIEWSIKETMSLVCDCFNPNSGSD